MYGIFFEDINLAADGGVYAELVKNRSFEFDSHLAGWKEQQKEWWKRRR
jgi:alpha-N-arabinofuranosidase